MANVGKGPAGYPLTGRGTTSPSGATFLPIGTDSGLTAHGVVIAEGSGAFTATSAGTTGYVLTSNGASSDPTFQPVSSSGSVTNFTVDSSSGSGTNPVVPFAGNVSITGNIAAAQSIPIRTISTAANGFLIQNQVATNSGGSSINNAGMASFQSADFSVDASGFVSLSTTGAGKTITGDSGGALSPVSNNWNIVGGAALSAGTNAFVTSGSGATLTGTAINCAKWIVDATANRGTHTTIAAAITAASSGQTIFIRPGTYTENLTLKAGVNLTAFGSDGSLNNTGNVTIVGAHSMNTAGSVSISGIDFQTTTSVITITGSAASVVNFIDCYLTSSSGSIFADGSSNSSSQINVIGCTGNVGATGTVFAWSSTGTLTILDSKFTNTGGSGVQSTLSNGTAAISHTEMGNGVSTSSTGLLQLEFCTINTTGNLAISHAGSTSSYAKKCIFSTGTSGGVTISTTLGLFDCVIDSTNATPVAGAGTVIYSSVDFSNTSSTIGTSTKTSRVLSVGSLTLNTALTVANGGTGQTTLTNHGVLVGAATTAITQLAVGTNGQVLIGSTGADPVFGTLTSSDSSISFTTGAGTLSLQVAGGTTVGKTITGNTGGALSPTAGNWNIVGTGSTTASGSGSTLTVQLTGLTNHALQVGAGTATLTQLGAGTTGQVLQTNTSADPTWSTATYPSTTTVSQILYSSATNTVSGLATANNSILSTDGSGVPSLGTSLSNDYTFTSATSGATRTLTISNTSDTASSSANVLVSVAGATAADPTHQSVVTGVTTWTWGIDNSVTSPTADPWVLAQGTALGTNNVMSVATSGEINYPLQPAFLAYLNTSVLNVTGDSTEYTIIYDTEVFDANGDFNLGTSTFTAPVTGRYHIDVSGSLIGGTILSAVICRITTSNNVFRFTLPTNAAVTTTASAAGSVLCDMDAADTFTITLQATDTGGKVDDAAGTTGGQLRNWVSAQLSV